MVSPSMGLNTALMRTAGLLDVVHVVILRRDRSGEHVAAV